MSRKMKLLQFKYLVLFLIAYPLITFSQDKKHMKEFVFNDKGDLLIKPSATSDKSDFDFLAGKWTIHNRKLKSRFTNSTEWEEFDAAHEMRIVLTGIGNVENITASIN